MNCEICFCFERSLRDLEAALRETITECEAAHRPSESEEDPPKTALETALIEFFRQRGLYDHHRYRAHVAKSLPDNQSSLVP
jgi:hypothetical protein